MDEQCGFKFRDASIGVSVGCGNSGGLALLLFLGYCCVEFPVGAEASLWAEALFQIDLQASDTQIF